MAEDAKRVVQTAWAALASRESERIRDAFAEDAEWLAPVGNATAMALGGPDHLHGRDQIADIIGRDVWTLFARDVNVYIIGMYADANVVIVEQRLRATLSNGKAYDNDYCFVCEVENGRVRRVREYMDTAKGHRMIFGNS
jgi:ketosteroid isomerase-like protein